MLLNKIRTDETLTPFIKDSCCDNGICADVDERVDPSSLVIIKPDDFYNSLKLSKTPRSPDCLIIQKCADNEYAITVIELKNVDSCAGFEVDEVIDKFQTCFSDFMSIKYKNYFNRRYNRIILHLVSNVNIYKKGFFSPSLKLFAAKENRIRYQDKSYMIDPRMPSPLIRPC